VIKLSPGRRGRRVIDPPRRRDVTSVHVPRTPPSNATFRAATQHEAGLPIPIPVVDLSHVRCVPRVIDPRRRPNVIVLASEGSISHKSVAPEVAA